MTLHVAGRNPSIVHIAQFFEYDHLPTGNMKQISTLCSDTAQTMLDRLEDSPELIAGLRKLLEAKDCFVRAALGE